MILPVNGIYPRIHQSAWIAPTATIIGDVDIGLRCSIWFGTVIRGDVFKISIGDETNIQDNCVVHATYKKAGVEIGKRVTVGHQVILHGCKIGDGTLIGMGAILMDNCRIGKNSLVAAGSLVTENSTFEDGMLIMGRPAVAKRKLSPEELKHINLSADNYILYTSWYAGTGGKIP
ncbi:MAG: gamma carbonic anhydrase family protein [Oligoflexia bacterium]|nr:gamma carbonic anhydrase family protein [Oligoflexia bacterium]